MRNRKIGGKRKEKRRKNRDSNTEHDEKKGASRQPGKNLDLGLLFWSSHTHTHTHTHMHMTEDTIHHLLFLYLLPSCF